MIDFKQIIGISLNQNKMYSRCKGLKIIKHLYTLKFKIIYTTTIRQDILSLSLVTKSCLTLATPYTIACQAPLSMRFSRQEYWSGLSFPSPGDLPDPGIEPRSPALQANSFLIELWGKPYTLKLKITYTTTIRQDIKVILFLFVLIPWKQATFWKLASMKTAAWVYNHINTFS